MKSLLARGFEVIAHRLPDFRGKTRILGLYGRCCEGMPVATKYGVLMGLHFADVTNKCAILGWYGRVVADEVDKIESGDAFVDIGANAGLFSIMASKLVGKDGVVISFEPQTQLLSRLLNNCVFNDVSNLIAFGVGIGSTTRSVKFTNYERSHTGLARESSSGERTVWLVDLCADITGIKRIVDGRKLTVKIDTEGAELEVLKGIECILRTEFVKSVIVEIDDVNLRQFGSSPAQVYEFMEQMKFFPAAGAVQEDSHYDEVFVRETS